MPTFRSQQTVPAVLLAVLLAVLVCGCEQEESGPGGIRRPEPKQLTLAIRDDYDKGDDLEEIAKDFALIEELGVDELFVNIGWDDYEPEKDRFDFEWLHKFVELAAEHGLKLRPYICYKPWWEGDGRWNSPPSDMEQWRDFCVRLGEEMKRHENILSFEVWLEENAEMWWTGDAQQYITLLQHASESLRAANPGWQIALGGFTHPDQWFFAECTEGDLDQLYDVVPLHCYNETWADESLEEYFNSSYTGPFLRLLDEEGGRKPLWMSECGYSTMDRSEEDQANYIARVVPYFFADPASDDRFSLFTYYELKDLPVGSAMIGDEHNYHFGLCRSDRSKKLAFYTYRMLVALLHGRVVRAADAQVTVAATEGEFGEPHHHLLQREDGTQILFIYDRENAATAEAALMAAGSTCTQWELDGRSRPWPHFNGTTISNIALTPGQVRIYEIR